MAQAVPHRTDHQAEELWPGCWRHQHPHHHAPGGAHGAVAHLHGEVGHPHYHPGPGSERDLLRIDDHEHADLKLEQPAADA